MWSLTGRTPRELGELKRQDPVLYAFLDSSVRTKWRILTGEHKR